MTGQKRGSEGGEKKATDKNEKKREEETEEGRVGTWLLRVGIKG